MTIPLLLQKRLNPDFFDESCDDCSIQLVTNKISNKKIRYDIIRKLTARGLKRNRHEEMMQEYNEKFHEEPEETETTQKDTFSKKINAKINEYIDKNVNNK